MASALSVTGSNTPPRKTILQKGRGKDRKLAGRRYIYEIDARYFAQVSDTALTAAEKELASLGATDLSPAFRGIGFTADKQAFYRIVYQSRLVSRILIPLVSFTCPDQATLYREAGRIPWDEFMTTRHTFAVTANVYHACISHSNYAALRVKDAVVDFFRDRTGHRPSIDTKDPRLVVHLHLFRDQATLSLDAGPAPLYRRGYREASVSAPMQETVAATIIHLSGWDGTVPLYDPMCGSGTLLAEALMAFCRIPAQVFRTRFGFDVLPDYDPRTWKSVKETAEQAIRPLPPGLIAGSDLSSNSVQAARTNLMGLHHGGNVSIEQIDFRQIPSLENRMIVTNPPYGIRMGKDRDLRTFYRELGEFLRRQCRRSTALVYFGDPRYAKQVNLAPLWKRPLKIGGLDGKLMAYELH